MKVTDLMVGDWIQVKRGFNGHLTNEKIKGLIDDDTESYPITLATEETVSLNDVVPIELTEEILVRNGFRIQVVHNNSKWLWVTDSSWLTYSERHNYWYYEDMKITYIHQLQHFLRLCGVEKEIEL